VACRRVAIDGKSVVEEPRSRNEAILAEMEVLSPMRHSFFNTKPMKKAFRLEQAA
jgi:hypothetical protein